MSFLLPDGVFYKFYKRARETPVCGPHTVSFLQKQLFLTPNEFSYIGLLSPQRTVQQDPKEKREAKRIILQISL